jgi:hypothetical protein
MLDRRQEILDRLTAILTPLAPNFWRNRGEVPADMRPCITLCDADEMASDTSTWGKAKRGLIAAPSLMKLTPEIIISLTDQKPANLNVGLQLSTMRNAILNVVCFDQGLGALIGANGEIQYHGCATDLGRNRQMNGEMSVILAFVYPFIPAEIQT